MVPNLTSMAGKEPAADAVPIAQIEKRRGFLGADRHGLRAAWVEAAAGRQVEDAGHDARDLLQPGAPQRERSPSFGMDFSSPRVYGCAGASKKTAVRPASTILPAYMTMMRWEIRAMTPRSWVIIMIAIAELLFQVHHQLQDLGLDGHVERGGRLIGNQHGVAGQRHGDHGALAHAAGELVGIFPGALFRSRHPDLSSMSTERAWLSLPLAPRWVGTSRQSGRRR